jgi:hypothetical protein
MSDEPMEWQSGRRTVIPRNCLCTRRHGDPRMFRVAGTLTPGLLIGWARQAHCQAGCTLFHVIYQFIEGDAAWQRHFGIMTRREADEFTNLRPNGPTSQDIAKGYGA